MKTTISRNKQATVVNVQGPVKSGTEFDLADALEDILHKKENMIVNLEESPFINSAALGVLLNIYREAERQELTFSLCNTSKDIDTLLEITKVSDIIPIHKTLEIALEHA